MKIVKDFLKWNPPEKIQLDSFNYFLTHSVSQILEQEVIETKCLYIKIESVAISTPTSENTVGTVYATTPDQCIADATTYSADILATISYSFKNPCDKSVKKIIEKVCLGKLPVMVGSKICSLADKPNVLKCYFIVKGAKKVICMEERIAHNTPFLLSKKKEFKFYKYVEFKSVNTLLRSSLIDIGAKIAKTNFHIVVYCPDLTLKELMPIEWFLLLFLTYDDIKTELTTIVKCLPVNVQTKLSKIICDNFVFTISKQEVYQFVYDANSKITCSKDVKVILKERYLIHMTDLSLKEKGIFTLFLLKILLYGLVDHITIDDRDHYGNKRVYSVSHFFTTELFHVFHKKYKKKVIAAFDNSFIKPFVTEDDTVKRLLEKTQEITNSFRNCLTSNTWYGKTQSAQYVSQLFDPFNGIHYIDLIRKINTPVKNDNNRILGPRDLHLTQSDILCPYGTPDGKKVGLIKYPSVQAVLSCDTSYNMEEFVKTLLATSLCEMDLTLPAIIVNGQCIGSVRDSPTNTLKRLLRLKTHLRFFETSVHFSQKINSVIVMSDAGRLLYPIVVSKTCSTNSFVESLAQGYILLLDKNELETFQLKECDLFDGTGCLEIPCDLSFSFSLGYLGSLIPYSNHNQAPRNIYQCQMSKQAIGFLTPSDHPSTYNQLLYPQHPLVGTIIQTLPFFYEHPTGINAIVAIMPFCGENQEDSVILNKASLERGAFNSTRTITFRHILDHSDILCTPDEQSLPTGSSYNFGKLGKNTGLIALNSIVKKNDVLIAVKRLTTKSTPQIEPVLVFSIEDCMMQVTKVLTLLTEKGETMIDIVVTELLIPQIGDKFCLTPDHEVLTSEGWKAISTISSCTLVATLNSDNTFSFTKVLEVHKFDCKDELLYEIDSAYVSLRTTLSHKMLVKLPSQTRYSLIPTINCLGKNLLFRTTSRGLVNEQSSNRIYLSSLRSFNKTGTIPESGFLLTGKYCRLFLKKVLASEYAFDDLQRLACNCGYATYYTNSGQLSVKKSSPILNTHYSEKLELYSGSVHCLTVTNGVFLVRRNKKAVWTGNSSRHGQKGTVGMIFPQEDLPFTEEGISPDILINPLCIPSRMTVGHLLEMASGMCIAKHSSVAYCKICCHYKKSLSSPRCSEDCFLKSSIENYLHHTAFYHKLIPHHIKTFQNTSMYCGLTGKKLDSLIYVGVIYYQRLKHMSRDKVYVRTTGPIQPVTRQPKEGRSVEGGHRFGLQERDCILSHGCVYALRDRLFLNSDYHRVYICECGMIYHGKPPPKYEYACCKRCQSFNLYLIELPYASKVLIQLLLAFNIHMRLLPTPPTS